MFKIIFIAIVLSLAIGFSYISKGGWWSLDRVISPRQSPLNFVEVIAIRSDGEVKTLKTFCKENRVKGCQDLLRLWRKANREPNQESTHLLQNMAFVMGKSESQWNFQVQQSAIRLFD